MVDGEGTISTGVDGFIKLVRDLGKMEINDAATTLGLSRQVLEEWAAVLEEQGLIKVEYQLTKVYLVWIAKTKEEVEEKTSKIADVRATQVRRVESRVEELLELGRSLDLTVSQFKQISDIFEFKMGGVKDRLDKLKELEKSRNELNYRSAETEESFKGRIAGLKDAVDKSAKKVDEAKDTAAQLRKAMKDFEPALVKMRVLAADADIQLNKVQDSAKGVKPQLEDLERRYVELGKGQKKGEDAKEAAAKLRKDMKDFEPSIVKQRVLAADADIQLNKVQDSAKAVKSQLADFERKYAELGKKIEAVDMLVKESESQVASVRQALGRDTGGLVSQDAKAGQREKAYNAEINEQLSSLDALVKDFESRTSRKALIMGELRTLKHERDALFAELTALRKELMSLDVMKMGVDSMLKQIEEKKKRFEAKEKEIDAYEKKQADISSEIVQLFEMKGPPQAGGGRGK